MRRSAVNRIMQEADEFIRSFGFLLPPFAYLSPQEFADRRHELSTIVDSRLGWDITDYGQGRFLELGLFLFTLRNGRPDNIARGSGMLYAEKIMISRRDQISPLHRHLAKAEDIINRGGSPLAVALRASDPEGNPDSAARVSVPCDGVQREVEAGGVLLLQPGESVTLLPGVWHAFWGEGGDVLIGEVSNVNDDEADNVFHDSIGRFGTIEEDEPPLHLLVSDY